MTYDPHPSSLVELMVAAESTYGTLETPTVQIATAGAPSWGLGHQPIQGICGTSTIQPVLSHEAVRGIEVPFVNFTAPLSANSLATLMHMFMGTALSSNVWAVSGNPAGFTIGVNTQHPAGGADRYWKLTGCRVATGEITMPLGGMPMMALSCFGRRLLFPDTSPTTAPTLAPTTSARPYILTDCSMVDAATTAGLSGATAVPIRGFKLSADFGLLVTHDSSASSPSFLVRTQFKVSGEAEAYFSGSWWDEWKALVPADQGAAGGYSSRYLRFTLNDGTNILRLTMPVRVDIPQVAPADPGMMANLTFTAAGDDTAGTGGAPTNAIITAANV